MPAPRYGELPAQVDLPALDREVLAHWSAHGTFAASLEQREGCPSWTCYEGPPTANGIPGTHHVEARVFKDVFPRFKTMQGYYVERRAGWDCHGLPVELAVERELGFTGKAQIEAYGVAEFNARCRESVSRHVDAFTALTERMGFWLDFDAAYWTMDSTYVESVWWALKSIFDAGLLVEQYRVSPYCPRCGTALSDHELGQPGGYETVVDPSVYVRLPLTSGPYAGKAALLVWTTTPWTLVSNTSVAVRPDVDYVVATKGAESLVVAADLARTVLGEDWSVTATLPGARMEHWRYQRPFELVELTGANFVVLADYVSTDDGTGLVHQSPAFGAEDMAAARAYGLPVVSPVRTDGHFDDGVPLVGGQFFKHADATLVDDLRRRVLLFRSETLEHAYPHCWRCHTPLLYYALPSWYIKTTEIKDALLRENEGTTWHPETIKWGRYGDWLHNNVDWALSRDRYWGTPLPIWRCADRHVTCVGSLAELGELARQDLSSLDPHRPHVDDVVLDCPQCAQPARRVSQVIDAWFDSGSMPFAQWGFPNVQGSRERFHASYPAQFICEAIDQTRGWFYTLMAIGTMLFDESSYEHVLCLGHIVAEDGRKMSKHLGNVVEPMSLMDQHGADALRWFMLASGSPWASRRLRHAAIEETVRKVILTYWNTASFLSLYARSAGWTPADGAPEPESRPLLDRWLAGETAGLVAEVTAAMESYDTQRAGAYLARFVDDLSNWYVRRSRRRFWSGDPAALMTLHETLDVLTRLLAPIVPFVTERVWQDVVASVDPSAAESVHLAPWPTAGECSPHTELAASMSLARRIVELGRAARAQAKVKTRQPLRRALVSKRAWDTLGEELRAEICDELNLGALDPLGAEGEDLIDHSVKANYRALGRRFGKDTPAVAAALAAASPVEVAAALHGAGHVAVVVGGASVRLSAEEVVVSERPREGWSVANDEGETVALDLELTPALVRAGLAREAIRSIQEARKVARLEVSDRVRVWWEAAGDADLATAIREHREMIAAEVLAVDLAEGAPDDGTAGPLPETELGLRLWLVRSDDRLLTRTRPAAR